MTPRAERLDFDALTLDLARGLSRRQALARLGGALLGTLIASLGLERAWAAPCQPGQTPCGVSDVPNCCSEGQLCCDGVCLPSCGGRCCAGVCCNNSCFPAGSTCCSGVGACPAGQSCCQDQYCTDLQADVRNCGACGVACMSAQICSSGQCIAGCPEGQTLCSGSCCHGACLRGLCVQEGICPPDRPTFCDNACVNTNTDPSHCGSCGFACQSGLVCVNGQCSASCPEGGIPCGAACCSASQVCLRNPVTGLPQCVYCLPGHAACSGVCCPPGERCSNGACCLPFQVGCNGACHTCRSPFAERCCGTNGFACCDGRLGESCCDGRCCPAGQHCENGACVPNCRPCPDARPACCGGICTDPFSDSQNCGACGVVCPSGQFCSNGVCCQVGQAVCGGVSCTDAGCTGTCCSTVCCNGFCCPVGQQCENGACTRTCVSSQSCPDSAPACCGGLCVDPFSDPQNCGACGAVCTAPAICSGGRCCRPSGAACASDLTCCSGSCLGRGRFPIGACA